MYTIIHVILIFSNVMRKQYRFVALLGGGGGGGGGAQINHVLNCNLEKGQKQ